MMNYPYVNIHTHSESTQNGVVKLKSYLLGRDEPVSDSPYAIGLHPWAVNDADESLIDKFPVDDKNFVAVGEIGLDFSAKNLDKSKQFLWFDRQMKLAEKMKKPAVIHCVKAYNELLNEIGKYDIKHIIAHGFIGSITLAMQLIEAGFYLSFGVGSLRSHRTTEALKTLPLNRIFLETDDYIELDIRDIYEQVVEILGISDIEILKKEIYNSYQKCIIG